MSSISGPGGLRPPTTMTEITQTSFNRGGSTEGARFSEPKTLHMHSRLDASDHEFLASFRNRDTLEQRHSHRHEGARDIGQSIGSELGSAVGDLVFGLLG